MKIANEAFLNEAKLLLCAFLPRPFMVKNYCIVRDIYEEDQFYQEERHKEQKT